MRRALRSGLLLDMRHETNKVEDQALPFRTRYVSSILYSVDTRTNRVEYQALPFRTWYVSSILYSVDMRWYLQVASSFGHKTRRCGTEERTGYPGREETASGTGTRTGTGTKTGMGAGRGARTGTRI